LLAAQGPAWNVKVPSVEKIALRRLHGPAPDVAELEHG
jgi:stearoyl-CoA desaturase (delta-9 desaturase)